LFNLYLDYVLRIFFKICTQENIKFPKFDFRIIDTARQNHRQHHGYRVITENKGSRYADDIEMFFFETAVDLQKAILLLDNLF